MEPAEQPAAESLPDCFKSMDDSERRKHEVVLDYWLSIRAGRDLPPLRDLDPLEISDAAPSSILLELIGGGEDAEIRHLGERLKGDAELERIADAPRPSILSSIVKKLSLVAISRNFLAFEDEFSEGGSTTRCWVTLLPLSSAGAWVDYVYAFVSFEAAPASADKPARTSENDGEAAETVPEEVDETAVIPALDVLELETPAEKAEEATEAVQENDERPAAEPEAAPASKKAPGFSFDAKASASGFYGTQVVKVEPKLPAAQPARKTATAPADEKAEPAASEKPEAPAIEQAEPAVNEKAAPRADEKAAPPAKAKPEKPTSALEGSLQSKLAEVRTKADEARTAKLRSNTALYEGLSAAYDFALDAEDCPEEYLKLVEGRGLKIQLRSPMTPVVKLAFDGMCDDSTLAQLEAVLAWALKQDLPRGTLAERIEAEGGIGPILNGQARAA